MEGTETTTLSVIVPEEEKLTCPYGCKTLFTERKRYNQHVEKVRCNAGINMDPVERNKILKDHLDAKVKAKSKECSVCGKKFTRAADKRRHEKTCQSHQAKEKGELFPPPPPVREQVDEKERQFYRLHLKKCPSCDVQYLPIKEHKKEHDCLSKNTYKERAAWYCDLCHVCVTPVLDHIDRHKESNRHWILSGDSRPLPSVERKRNKTEEDAKINQGTVKKKKKTKIEEEKEIQRDLNKRRVVGAKLVPCEECGGSYIGGRRYEHNKSGLHRKYLTLDGIGRCAFDLGVLDRVRENQEILKKKKIEQPNYITKEIAEILAKNGKPMELERWGKEEGLANKSPVKFTAKGFKNFLNWRASAGNIDPEATNVGDVLKRSKAGPMKVDFPAPVPYKKKAFEGWADGTDKKNDVIS